MQAELKGKVNVTSTQPGERLEDTLTDAVFSAVAYLQRGVVLAKLLRAAFPTIPFSTHEINQAKLTFWPRFSNGVEPDVIIEVGPWVVVIEAKYGAPFSKGPDPRDHQLYGEWRAGRASVSARKLQGPLLLAVTTDPAEPPDIGLVRGLVTQDEPSEESIPVEEQIRWLRWQTIAAIIEAALSELTLPECRLAEDLLALMDRRGVRTVFEGFEPEDYWLVTAAARVGVARVFPSIATLAEELSGLLAEDDIVWGATEKGVWSFRSLSVGNPGNWGTTYIMLPFWPTTWPARSGKSIQVVLYVMFDFVNPAVEVGYFQATTAYSTAKNSWQPLAADLATEIARLPAEYQVSVSDGDYTNREEFRSAPEVEGDWLAEAVATHRRITIARRLPIDTVTSAETLRAMIVEDAARFGAMPVIRKSAVNAGLLAAAPPG